MKSGIQYAVEVQWKTTEQKVAVAKLTKIQIIARHTITFGVRTTPLTEIDVLLFLEMDAEVISGAV